jgi:hypothetical protein
VTSPTRQGLKALKVTLKYGDVHSSGNRAEVVRGSTALREATGSEYYYRFQVMFDPTYPRDDRWQLFAQWHHEGSSGSPPLEFTIKGDSIELATQSAPPNQAKTVHWSAPMNRGTWHDIVIRVKWSPDRTVGFVELFHNNMTTPALPKKYVATQFPGQLNYLKAGLYRHKDILKDGILYHDGWVQGRTLADVLQ